jgi:Ca-activated chloride channel family protein
MLLLVPLPYLVHRFLPVYERPSSRLVVSFFRRVDRLLDRPDARGEWTRSRLRAAGLMLAWLLALLALTAPVQLGAPVRREVSARDLLLAVDLSGSMSALDLATPDAPQGSRLDVVKSVVGSFVEARHGDRLGLVVFGDAPFVQVPFTTDTTVVRELLDETDVGMAGPRTALGDAVGLCLRVFERSQAKQRVVVVLTDGNDTGSLVTPLRAARIAREQEVRLYLIGVGDPRGLGEESLNEDVLRQMAQATGGRYLHATSEPELARVYAEIAGFEPIARTVASYQPKRSVAFVPLACLAALLVLASLVAGTTLLADGRRSA